MKIIIHLPAGKKQIKRLKRFLTELHSEMKPELKKEEATDDLISTFLDVSLHRVQIGKSTFSEYLGYCISLPDASRMKQLLKEWEKEDLLICTKPETKPGTERYPNSTKVHVEKNTHMTPPVFHAKPAPEFEHKNELPNYWEHTSPADAPVIPLYVGGHLGDEIKKAKVVGNVFPATTIDEVESPAKESLRAGFLDVLRRRIANGKISYRATMPYFCGFVSTEEMKSLLTTWEKDA